MLSFDVFKSETEDFLKLPRGSLSRSSWIGNPPAWDSIAHAEWVVWIEERHNVIFDFEDFVSFRDLQSVYKSLASRKQN